MKVNIYLNGWLICTTRINNQTAQQLQNDGFVLEMVKEDK